MALTSWLGALFDARAREARQLNRDAPEIIEAARESYRSELVRDIALLTHRRTEEALTHCAGDERCIERAVRHFRTLHREARRKRDHVGLTAYTLIIIYLRGHLLGDACAPARAEIDEFLAHWRHARKEA